MRWWRGVKGWRPGTSRQGREPDLERELRAHLELEAEELQQSGSTAPEAADAARRALGNTAQIKEDTRRVWTWTWIEQLANDARYAAGQLRRNPGFAAVAVVTIALGIGANTAVFSVINAVLLREPPYREPARLVRLWESFPKMGDDRLGTSPPEYLDYRDRNRVFSSIAAYSRAAFDLTDAGEAERIAAAAVSSSLFETLGVTPLAGRAFEAGEDRPGDDNVALLSHSYWQRRYAGSTRAVGSTLRLNERLYTIVGVMPPGFEFPATAASTAEPPALWVPLAFTPQRIADRAADFSTHVIARLGDGVSLDQARADVARVAEEFQREHPQIYAGSLRLQTIVEPLAAEHAGDTRPVLWTLAGAVAFVLLIACSNVANLLLGRAAARRREMALRNALGASRARLIRQLLTESVLLTFLGGALGAALAQIITLSAATLGPEQVPGLRAAAIDPTVLAFTLGLSLLTGVLCGLAPAFGLSRTNGGETLKQAGRQSGGLSRSSRRTRAALVVIEAASAVVLLVCSGLLIRSFAAVMQQAPGFEPDGVLAARTSFNRERYADSNQRRQAERLITERLAALAGVKQVAVATHLPLADSRGIGFAIEGRPAHESHWASHALVSGEYFATMGIPLLRGRTFTAADTPDGPISAVISESMARTFWPREDPIGRRIFWGGRTLAIVGIAGDVKLAALDQAVPPMVYNSVYQVESGATTSGVFVVRANTGGAAALASAVRETIQSVDRGLPVFDVRTMGDIVARSVAARRFVMLLLAAFAALALTLAVIGLYAVLAYAVAQRTPELGVRLALGAPPARLVLQVLGEGLRLAAVGVVLGAVAAGAAATAMSSLLFGVGALDPVAFFSAAALLLMVGLAASYVPARRAARVDPLVALRYE
jgi:putative ABC transport system permease protein